MVVDGKFDLDLKTTADETGSMPMKEDLRTTADEIRSMPMGRRTVRFLS